MEFLNRTNPASQIRDPKFLIGLRLTESNQLFRNFGFEMGFCPISQFPPAGYSSMLLPSQRRGGCAERSASPIGRSLNRSSADTLRRTDAPPLRGGEYARVNPLAAAGLLPARAADLWEQPPA